MSYGSFRNIWGTETLIIKGGKISHPRITATSKTSGNPEDQEAYRSELSGIIHTITIIGKICSKFNIIEAEITAACDGMDAIIMAMDKYTYFSIKSENFDMLSAIDAKLEQYNIQWNWRYFKG